MTVAPLRTQRLGDSPVRVTELSLGGAPIGNLFTEVSDEAAEAAVAAAWRDGIRTFDTAPHYGLGLSERRLGAALRQYPRDDYVICTKVGRLLERACPPYGGDTEGFAVSATRRRVRDYSASGVLRSLEASLDRLSLDRIDVALIHDPDDHGEQALREAYPALERLRGDGCVRAIGVGMNQAELLTRFVTETDVDVVLIAGRYTLLDQSACRELLPAAIDRGVSVLAGGVFNSGLLAAPAASASYDYRPADSHLVARARHLEAICAQFGVPLRAAAARFPIRHPAVASVLIGARSAAEVDDATSLWHSEIPAALWDALETQQAPSWA
jgi:D-threo-aldose 1-dehydrogenase